MSTVSYIVIMLVCLIMSAYFSATETAFLSMNKTKMKTLAEKGDGFVRAMWCGSEECEDKVKELTGVGSRCIPFEQEQLSDVCVCCGRPAKKLVYWGKAY